MGLLRRIDLNLLLTLQALLEEKHISRAALRLHKSQPTVSHALARLRELFDDPLLVRNGNRLELTSRANEIQPLLEEALGRLDSLLDPPSFIPGQSRRMFRLAMSDYGAQVVLPQLNRTIRDIAPSIELVVKYASREAMVAGLIDGEIDLALGVFPRLGDQLHRQTLFTETFACIVDAETLVDGVPNLEAWLRRPHALLTVNSEADNEIDLALEQQGLQRHIALRLPYWGLASDIVSGTDLILTVARRNTANIALDARFSVFEPPLAIPPFRFEQVWHARREHDSAHRWLRELTADLAAFSIQT